MKSVVRVAVAALTLRAAVAARVDRNASSTTSASPVRLRKNGKDASAQTTAVALHAQTPTFQAWYSAYTIGRGIWKWEEALDAYQAFFGRYAGQPVALLEIGVQSGGSIDMYQAVLGAQCHYYGMDINTRTTSFQSPDTTIAILDQGDAAQWAHFFTNVVPTVDIVVDDGGHQSHQMLTTFQQAYPKINPGGVHLIEDVHGEATDYLTTLFYPIADFLGATGTASLAMVSIYPFVLVVQKSGGAFVPPTPLPAAATLTEFADLLGAIKGNPGKVLHLANPAWGSMFTADGLRNVFASFYELHQGVSGAEPAGCFAADANKVQCTMTIANSVMQSQVTSVDVFPNLVQVHVAATPPNIHAVRRGTEWIPYSGQREVFDNYVTMRVHSDKFAPGAAPRLR